MDFLQCRKCNMKFKSLLLLEKHKEKFCIGGDFGRTDLMEKKSEYKNKQQERREQQKSLEKEVMLNLQPLKTKPQDQSENPDPNPDLNPVQARKANGKPGYGTNTPWTHDQEGKMRNLVDLHGKRMLNLKTENSQLEEHKREIDLQLQELAAQTKGVSRVEEILLVLQAQEQRNAILLESLVEQLQHVQMGKHNTQSGHDDSRLYSTKKKKKGLIPSYTYIPANGDGALSSEISALRLSYLQSGGNDHLILAHFEDLLNEALEVEMHNGKKTHTQPHHSDTGKFCQLCTASCLSSLCDARYCHFCFLSVGGKERGKIQLNRDVIAAELENRRLEADIMKIQQRKWRNSRFSRMTCNTPKQSIFFPYTFLLGQPVEHNMKPFRMNRELLRQEELEMNHLRQQMKANTMPPPVSTLPPLEDIRFHTPTLGEHFHGFSNDLGPAPYDPVAGFVVFYDFLLGLPPLCRVCRLVVRLYAGEQEMGSPGPLPVVYCEPTSLSQHVPKRRKGNLVTFATKQAVPRVLPSPAVSLVLELQASEGYDQFGEEVKRLVSRGWVKLDIFDRHNRVISGNWKVPVRVPPIRPSMTMGELNTVPQLDSAELYLRVVNFRDAEVQSSIPVSISYRNEQLYKYPPPVFTRVQLASGNSLRSPRFSQIVQSNIQFPAFSESVDSTAPTGPPEELR
ncbi:coiled-coil domain-containing protein 17 [Arapaima gigas]